MSVLSDRVDAPPPQPSHRLLGRKGRRLTHAVAVGALLTVGVDASTQSGAQLVPESHVCKVEVLITSMFAPGAQPWINKLGFTQGVPVPDLSIDYPSVYCNASDIR